ncbi:hypothetical protein SAMN05661044_04979 [Olivibacter domesticus]|uniref:Uncharacterized protein n=1 Tax=Olivibacter domesticus TaxID=407022 RepID=A0A1H7XUF7_OLID1|nr:hypothetical protein SAMN05661044_04979 [Olivibacter domesticus]
MQNKIFNDMFLTNHMIISDINSLISSVNNYSLILFYNLALMNRKAVFIYRSDGAYHV